MYLQYVELHNFRCSNEKRRIYFRKGLNVLVGENDSGKSAIIDAIRIVMGTTDQSWYHIEQADFNEEDRQKDICITLKFSELSLEEQAAFLECLTFEDIEGNISSNVTSCANLYTTADGKDLIQEAISLLKHAAAAGLDILAT